MDLPIEHPFPLAVKSSHPCSLPILEKPRTSRDDVVMQLDLGNCIGGGGDPIAVLKKFPGRSQTIHLKEFGGKEGAVIGQGDVDWKTVFRLCESSGRTEWYVVEQESYDGPPLESVKRCIESLRKMGK